MPYFYGYDISSLIWLIPAILAFLAGFISKKKLSKKEKTQ